MKILFVVLRIGANLYVKGLFKCYLQQCISDKCYPDGSKSIGLHDVNQILIEAYDIMATKKLKVPELIKNDPWLAPYEDQVRSRIDRYENRLKALKEGYGGLKKFASAYQTLAFNYDKKRKGWTYREWAPGATG